MGDSDMIKTKLVSSLEKAFVDEKIEKFDKLERISALRGERLSFQLLHTQDEERFIWMLYAPLSLSGALAEFATSRDVCHVPVIKPINYNAYDENYLRTAPGIYPDVLRPLHQHGCAVITYGVLGSIWIEVDIPADARAGSHTLTVSLNCEKYGYGIIENTITIDVIDAILPKDPILNTEWLHCDSLATYYNVKVWTNKQ